MTTIGMQINRIGKNGMKNREMFVKALETLLYSWGGDTPPEAFWAVNELLDFYEAETGEKIPRFTEESDGEWSLYWKIAKQINPDLVIPKEILDEWSIDKV